MRKGVWTKEQHAMSLFQRDCPGRWKGPEGLDWEETGDREINEEADKIINS